MPPGSRAPGDVERIEGEVRGFLHRAPGDRGLILSHGAGSNASAPLLVAVATDLAQNHWNVLRIDLPFRHMRPKGPPGPGDAKRDQDGIRDTIAFMKDLGMNRIFAGGHSYGGRQTTMMAARDNPEVEGLLLMSYPLHPPSKPQQLRTAHFPELKLPCLFIHGEADPFGTIDEMREATGLISGRVELRAVSGAGHDLRGRGHRIAGWFLEWSENTGNSLK